MQSRRLSGLWAPLFLLTLVIVLSVSCRKEKFLASGGEVAFSTDTLMFDTVFTAQGSATRSIRIYNRQKEQIKISSIRLKKGSSSPYRLNVDGVAGTEIRDVEIAGNDSVWVFAAVTIDPTNEDNPFLTEDELIVSLNGRDFTLPFVAFGQNANYIVDSLLSTQTWNPGKPYVIVRNAAVDEGATLTINAGTRVYVHRDSRLFVFGSLKINGTKTDSVIFQGDRLDPLVWIGDYIDIPGQWGGIYFAQQSYNNEINYAVIKNGGAPTSNPFGQGSIQGASIQIDPDTVDNGIPKLKLNNTVIRSSLGYGILSFGGSLTAENCRITECGGENIMFFQGGDYRLYDCTIGTYGSQYLSHTENLSMAILNYYPTSQTTYLSGPLTAEVKNCIVYGSLDDEVFFDRKPDHPASINLDHSLLRSKEPIPGFVSQTAVKLNEDPQFADYSKDDYHLKEGSPARAAGTPAGTDPADLDGVLRQSPPSMGCFEFHE